MSIFFLSGRKKKIKEQERWRVLRRRISSSSSRHMYMAILSELALIVQSLSLCTFILSLFGLSTICRQLKLLMFGMMLIVVKPDIEYMP
uniref:Uncharacterized protein n=1 Tax=Rhizophora mucronata TaxID=61149 RepID=A0A2P2QC46_RHIMU